VAVDELGAELDRNFEAGHAARPGAAADAVARLEHQHRASCLCQLGRRGESRGAGADDDYIAGRRLIPL
jgi:hypothetical protein